MAIDIKTLRIGSHILVNGKRERVRGLDEDNGLIIRFSAEYVLASEVEPIAITPELLKELGLNVIKHGCSEHFFLVISTLRITRIRAIGIMTVTYELSSCMNWKICTI